MIGLHKSFSLLMWALRLRLSSIILHSRVIYRFMLLGSAELPPLVALLFPSAGP
jgi:hypothetical protein